jgi:exopolysaccharide production protein ExoY
MQRTNTRLSLGAIRTGEVVDNSGGSISKRIFDVTCATALVMCFTPLILTISVVMKVLEPRSPILYRHSRMGRHGRVFLCLKFRTMRVNSDQLLLAVLQSDPVAASEWSRTGKMKGDPRVGRFGKFLRSNSLDEIPQLWNVLRGDMSVVGPRPVVRAELDGPYSQFDGRLEYLSVRPGMTGLWQISGRNDLNYQERVALDKAYVTNKSLLIDAIILCRTIGAVLSRRGAY